MTITPMTRMTIPTIAAIESFREGGCGLLLGLGVLPGLLLGVGDGLVFDPVGGGLRLIAVPVGAAVREVFGGGTLLVAIACSSSPFM